LLRIGACCILPPGRIARPIPFTPARHSVLSIRTAAVRRTPRAACARSDDPGTA
jgi:hypothetical protein